MAWLTALDLAVYYVQLAGFLGPVFRFFSHLAEKFAALRINNGNPMYTTQHDNSQIDRQYLRTLATVRV